MNRFTTAIKQLQTFRESVVRYQIFIKNITLLNK